MRLFLGYYTCVDNSNAICQQLTNCNIYICGYENGSEYTLLITSYAHDESW